MGLIDQISVPPAIGVSISKGVLPSLRRPGLRDPVIPGAPGADRFAPGYSLMINGIAVPEAILQRITRVEFEDNEDLFDQLTIELSGFIDVDKVEGALGAAGTKSIPIAEFGMEETWFSEGNIVGVFMGYGADFKCIGGGEIVKRKPLYQGETKLTVTCYEPTHRMAQEEPAQAKVYKGLISSSIVKQIAQKSAYSGVKGALFDTSQIGTLPIFTPRAETQRQGESDWAFLKRLADVRGWHLFSRFNPKTQKFTLFYGPDVDGQQEVFRYEFGREQGYPIDALESFEPEVSVIDQNTEIELIAFDDQRKKKLSSVANFQSAAEGSGQADRKLTPGNATFKPAELRNAQQYRLKAFGTSKRLLVTRPFKDEKEVKAFVINYARQQIKNFITGTAEVSGNESLKARQNIIFAGLGATLSGSESKPAAWYISKAVHTFEGGQYRVRLECRKVVDWIPGDTLATDLAGAALTAASGAIGW